MNRYRWTLRVAIGGVAVIAVFVAVVRGFGVMIAGVYPEAWVLTAMMTAPRSPSGLCPLRRLPLR